MRYLFATVFFFLLSFNSFSQTVFDKGHFDIVNENGAVRLASELTYHSSLDRIRRNTDDITLNIGSLVLAQSIINSALTEVNETLKDAIQIKDLSYLLQGIIRESNNAMDLAVGNPALLLFTEDVARDMKTRGLKLVTEVSDFVLKEGGGIVMNHNIRDVLMKRIIDDLYIMYSMIYTLNRSMLWVKREGMIKALNPYQQYINQDKRMIEEIIRKRHYLK